MQNYPAYKVFKCIRYNMSLDRKTNGIHRLSEKYILNRTKTVVLSYGSLSQHEYTLCEKCLVGV